MVSYMTSYTSQSWDGEADSKEGSTAFLFKKRGKTLQSKFPLNSKGQRNLGLSPVSFHKDYLVCR